MILVSERNSILLIEPLGVRDLLELTPDERPIGHRPDSGTGAVFAGGFFSSVKRAAKG